MSEANNAGTDRRELSGANPVLYYLDSGTSPGTEFTSSAQPMTGDHFRY